jgi:hypothetical protein
LPQADESDFDCHIFTPANYALFEFRKS